MDKNTRRYKALLAAAALAVSMIGAGGGAQAGTNPYCPSCGSGSAASPESRYEQYKSTLGQSGQAKKPAAKLFVSPGSSTDGGGAEPFYLKGIMENPTTGKYGMQYTTSTPPQPFSMTMGKKGSEKYPTTADLQAMAQKDQAANLKSALADSAERTRALKELQDAWAAQQGNPAATPAPPPGTGQPGEKSAAPKPNIKYVYRKGDPTKVTRPSRVFRDNR